MKKLIILIISNLLIANVVTNNAAITIDSGVTVTINGDFQNTGSIVNYGAIYLIDGQYDHNDDDGAVGTISGGGIFSLCDQPKELHVGANLISFYAIPEDSSVTNVLSDLGANATGIITEGGAATQMSEGQWVGSLTYINPLKGYWIIINENDSLSLCEATLTRADTVYALHSGANLISFPSFRISRFFESINFMPNDLNSQFILDK